MKNAAVIFFSFAIACIFVLGCNPKQGNQGTASNVTTAPVAGAVKLAYVNIDTLEAKYELLKTKREELKKRQEEMDNEIQVSYSQMQNDANEVQKKIQANTLTQPEYEAAQKRLMQMQKSLENRKQSLTEQLIKEQEDFNESLKNRLHTFIEGYNKDKHYDFIFTYSTAGAAGSSLLYANKALDITKDIVDGMNESAKNDDKKATK